MYIAIVDLNKIILNVNMLSIMMSNSAKLPLVNSFTFSMNPNLENKMSIKVIEYIIFMASEVQPSLIGYEDWIFGLGNTNF